MNPPFFALHLLPAVLRSWLVSRSETPTERSLNRNEAMAEISVAERWEMYVFIFLPVRPHGFGTEQGLTRQSKNPHSAVNRCGCLALSMNHPSPGLRPPSPRMAGRGQGEGRIWKGSWARCMRKRERGLP